MLLQRPLRIVIPGGTGRLGMLLARHFHEQGHAVSTISRFPKPRDWEAIHWDAETMGHWASSFEGADVIINLAGRSTRCRYTLANKTSILHSRVRTTQLVGEAIGQCARPPRIWLNASTVNVYPNAQSQELDEASGDLSSADPATPEQWRFSIDMAKSWEAAVWSFPTHQTRKMMLRFAPVMTPEAGGAFDSLLRLVRWGLGGELGNGEQYVAWIHDFDLVRSVEFLIDQDDFQGVVNIAAPQPLPNHQFMCNLRRAWCTSYFGLSARKWLVEAISFAIRIEPELVLKSRRVMPSRLLDAGFSFHFPEWRGACENLVGRWRALRSV